VRGWRTTTGRVVQLYLYLCVRWRQCEETGRWGGGGGLSGQRGISPCSRTGMGWVYVGMRGCMGVCGPACPGCPSPYPPAPLCLDRRSLSDRSLSSRGFPLSPPLHCSVPPTVSLSAPPQTWATCSDRYDKPALRMAVIAPRRPTVGDRVVLTADYASHSDAAGGAWCSLSAVCVVCVHVA